MKFISILFAAFWLVLTASAPAHAGPVAAAIGAIGSFLASGTVIANLVLGALLTAARIGIGLLTKAKQTTRVAGVDAQVKVGGDNPLSFIMGSFATAGQLEYINTWGSADHTPNAFLVQVISLGDLPVGSLTGLWVGDKKCTLPSGVNTPTTSRGYTVSDFYDSKHDNDCLYIKFYDGTQTEADPYLIAHFGDDPDRPWSSDMIGAGVPYVVISARVNPKLFSGIPTFILETDGIPLYDISKDDTAGGDGDHRWSDQSTWEPSNNNAVQVYNVLRGISYDGEWVWGGQTIGASALPAANWIAAINACNASVDLADDTTEPAYRAGCEISVDQEPADVIEDLVKGCSGRIAEIGGIYKMLAGAPGAAVYSFTDESIIVTEGQSFDPFPGLESTYNGAQASYPEPSEKWQAKDAPAYLRSDLEALDDDRRLVQGLQYPDTPYAVQVQRLLQAAVQDARRFRQHSFFLPPEAWLLEPNDVVSWTSERNGYDEKKFIVVEIEGGSNFLQSISLKEIDPADYSWDPDTDQQDYSVGYLAPIRPGPQALVGWQVAASTFYDADSNARRPSVAVKYAGGLEDVTAIRVQVRLKLSQALIFDAETPYDAPEDEQYTTVLNGTFLPDAKYQARGIYDSSTNREFDWSDWLDVTTPDVRFGATDIYDGVIDLDKLDDDVSNFLAYVGGGQRAALEALWQDVNNSAQLSIGTFMDVQHSETRLQSTYDDAVAYVDTSITVATGPGSALASQITDVSASVDDISAEGLLSITANTSPPSGILAEVDIAARAEVGDDAATAALLLQVYDDSGTLRTRVIGIADQFILRSEDGSAADNPFVFDSGVLTLAVANIGTVNAGILQDATGEKMIINLNAGTIDIFT